MNARTPFTVLSTPRAVALIARAVALETLRRKEFHVLLLLAGLYAVGTLLVGIVGIENPATATFLLNLGMSFACFAAHLLVLVTAARQIPDEMENRTLHPLLAKPLERGQYLLGKWVAVTLTGAATFVVLLALAWLPVPKLQSFDFALLVQAFVLQIASIALISALALALSLALPKGVNLLLVALLWLGGARVAALARAHFESNSVVERLTFYIPNFNNLDLITRYTDGMGPVATGQFLGLLLYAAVWTALALGPAALAFQRKPL